MLDDASPRLFRKLHWAVISFWAFALGFAVYVLLPIYAELRSPLRDETVVQKYCGDPTVPVVCYPRNCDSVGFYLGRDDLRSTRSKHVHLLIQDLQSRPRTVVLFTHNHSFEAFSYALPADLRITHVYDARQNRPDGIFGRLVGDTPWGLCDIAV